MAKPTLLDIVQDIMAPLSGDTVNSVFDTVESEQIARIVGQCYEVLKVKLRIPENSSPFELIASGDSAKPILMTKPSVAKDIDWIKYDCRLVSTDPPLMTDLKNITFEDFLDMSLGLDTTQSFVESFELSVSNATIRINYRNDVPPTYWTTHDNSTLLFDAYNKDVETTLQKDRTLAYGRLANDFSLLDTWVPSFDDDGIVLLKQDALNAASSYLRLVDDQRSAKNARTLAVSVTKKYDSRNYDTPYTFGRRRVK